MTAWLRRNAVAFAVIALLMPLYYFVLFVPHYDEYAKTRNPEPDVVVPYGQSTEVAGTSWAVQKVLHESSSRSSFSKGLLPEGLEAVRVIFDRTAASSAKRPRSCIATLMAGETRWESRSSGYMVSGKDVDIAKGPVGTTPICDEPETYQEGFLVPKDTKPDAVEISFVFEGSNKVVRFLLPT